MARPAFLDNPFKKEPFSNRKIFDYYAKFPDSLDRSPEITLEDRENMKLQFPNARSGQFMTGQYTLYATRTEYRIHKAFPDLFIVTVFDISNSRDTSRPKDKYFLIPT